MAIEDMIKRIMDEASSEKNKTLSEARAHAQSIRTEAERKTIEELDILQKRLI